MDLYAKMKILNEQLAIQNEINERMLLLADNLLQRVQKLEQHQEPLRYQEKPAEVVIDKMGIGDAVAVALKGWPEPPPVLKGDQEDGA
jgi:hypothetical protein